MKLKNSILACFLRNMPLLYFQMQSYVTIPILRVNCRLLLVSFSLHIYNISTSLNHICSHCVVLISFNWKLNVFDISWYGIFIYYDYFVQNKMGHAFIVNFSTILAIFVDAGKSLAVLLESILFCANI